jgi:hypothetical protein
MGSTKSKDKSQMKIPDGIYFNFYSFLELGRTSLWAIFIQTQNNETQRIYFKLEERKPSPHVHSL